MSSKNVLIVEDDTASGILLRKICTKNGYTATLAQNGLEALDRLRESSFEAILTDWMMPKLDGIELIKKVRGNQKNPPAIIVITALNSQEAKYTALEAGADDYISKPVDKTLLLSSLEKCIYNRQESLAQQTIVKSATSKTIAPFVGVGITASTGGPKTLLQVISGLQPTSLAAFFLVLHGPAWMLDSFRNRIAEKTNVKIHLATNNLEIKAGEVYLAPGDSHMVINPNKMAIQLTNDPPENFVRPAADPLFRSIARVFGKKSIAVVLTGMGRDGSIGAGYISAAGGTVIAQDPSTAILPSMPQTVVDLRLAKYVATHERIPALIMTKIKEII